MTRAAIHTAMRVATLCAGVAGVAVAAEPQDHAAHDHATPAAPAPAPMSTSGELEGHPIHDPLRAFVLVDRLEWRDGRDDALAWDLTAWIGRDFDRLWLRAEGERAAGSTEASRVEALWGHAFARWWDVVAGLRHDFAPGDSLTWAAVGVQGVAPYHFDVELTAYLGEGGHTALVAEVEYEVLLTQKLVLQPRLSAEAFGRSDEARAQVSGIAEAAAGLRLRYELRRELAPYVGIERAWHRGGAGRDDWYYLAGLRAWL